MENPFQHGPYISISFSSNIYLHIFRYLYSYLHVFAFLHTNLHTSQQINVYFKKLKQYMCIHIDTLKKYTYICTYTHIQKYFYIYICLKGFTYTHICINTNIYILHIEKNAFKESIRQKKSWNISPYRIKYTCIYTNQYIYIHIIYQYSYIHTFTVPQYLKTQMYIYI